MKPTTNRQSNGQFANGNSGGPGNPFAHKVGSLRKALLETFKEDDLREVIGRLITMAKSGDLPAMKLLFGYTIGAPGAAIDPDEIELRAIRLANRLKEASEPTSQWDF